MPSSILEYRDSIFPSSTPSFFMKSSLISETFASKTSLTLMSNTAGLDASLLS